MAVKLDSLRWTRRRLEQLSERRLQGFSATEEIEYIDLCAAEEWFLDRRSLGEFLFL